MSYRKMIESLNLGVDARHIEAHMRVEHGTLDALSPDQFLQSAAVAACAVAAEPELAEALADSYGLPEAA